ncbi:21119_t:CDS:2, partial [Racocetra persica]
MKTMDNWYKDFLSQEEKELLQICRQNRQQEQLIKELTRENEVIQQLAVAELKANWELFANIQQKKQELRQLKSELKSKLTTEISKNHLKNLLTAQAQLIYLAEANQKTRSPSERLLQQAQENLQNQLNEKKINQLCQLQTEITSLEIKLEQEQAQGKEELQNGFGDATYSAKGFGLCFKNPS